MQPLLGNRAVSLVINIDAMGGTRRLSIDVHTKPHRSCSRRGSHDEMQIAGVKAIGDPPVGLVQHARSLLYSPLAREGPMVQPQLRWGGVETLVIRHCTTG